MLSVKHRSGIVLTVVFFVFFVPAICLLIFSSLNIIVAKDPRITDKPYHVKFKLSGTLARGGCDSMLVSTRNIDGWEMSVRECNRITSIPLDPDGQMRGGRGFTIFWIYMKNPVLNTVQRVTRGYQTKIVDPFDILGGGKEATYTITMKRPFILWSPILESQASYEMGVYDASGVEIATATIDGTCGMLFELVTHRNGAGRIELLQTDFPISRNRYSQVRTASVSSVLLAIIALMRYFRSKPEDKPKRKWGMRFILWGIVACFVDIYPDVWWPFAFGVWGLLGLHALALLPGAIWCGWWILPGIIEVIWAGNFALQTGTLIPQLTHCPGIIISWMMATLFFRIPRNKS